MFHPAHSMRLRTVILLLFSLASLRAVGRSQAEDHPRSADTTFVVSLQYESARHPERAIYPHRPLKRPKIGLVLSGGGARGAAQIGVLRVLEHHGIPIDFIAATSMGALVGGLYASGYTIKEIENLALTTNWDEVLSLTDQTRRRELFVDQKLAGDRNFLAIRFQGLQPVIPAAVSSGQRLTDFLSNLTLESLYHGYPTFDNLKIPFRAIATDLISGARVVLKDGPLAEALRGSATVPLLFSPMEKDGMRLVDGGLVDNIPVDVAKEAGCDIIIAVNTTSGLRTADQMTAPWQTADQIMGIMMGLMNNEQIKQADVVITPRIGGHLSSSFTGLDSLITEGAEAAEAKIGDIERLYRRKTQAMLDSADTVRLRDPVTVDSAGGGIPPFLWARILSNSRVDSVRVGDIREHLREMYATGDFRDIAASVREDSARSRITYTAVPAPVLQGVRFTGCRLVSSGALDSIFAPLVGNIMNDQAGRKALEDVVRLYRKRGYSLARVDSVTFDGSTGLLHVDLNEGIIDAITVEGLVRTEEDFVRSEFPLEVGDVFQIDKAQHGIANLNGTTLFDYVYLEVTYPSGKPSLIIRLKERPTQLVRLGVRIDNERHLQGSLDLRDENFHGTGTELGFTLDGGERNSDAVLEYKIHRLFGAYLGFNISAFYRTFDSNIFADGPSPGPNRWQRIRIGEYRDIRYGASVSFSGQLERLGNATAELLLQNVRLKSLENALELEERHRLAIFRFGTYVDTKDSYPFPTSGVGLNLSYEFAFQGLGSDVGYNALKLTYESYATFGGALTFHPKFTMGFADKTMPLSQQYRLGGMDSFFGLREDDQRGREILLLNLEYRYLLPIRLIFATYVRARYDLGTINAVPEEVKFSTLRHGVGAEIAFDTPVGAAAFGAGKSFYLGKNLPDNPIQQGPLLWYFSIGYQL